MRWLALLDLAPVVGPVVASFVAAPAHQFGMTPLAVSLLTTVASHAEVRSALRSPGRTTSGARPGLVTHSGSSVRRDPVAARRVGDLLRTAPI